MMRHNPAVCVEVDHIEDLVNWHSAICWGTYEELSGPDRANGSTRAVVFRIKVTEATGGEERLYWDLLPSAQNGGAPADTWLSQQLAQHYAQLCGALDAEDVWAAADAVAEGQPCEQIEASLVYRGTDPELAHRVTGYLFEIREQPLVAVGSD